MPVLIVNLSPLPPRGLVLSGRVLIGRRPFNTVLVPDPSVSRIHAWVAPREGRYVLTDAGSRAGTLINGEPLLGPRALADGDEVRVGPAVLTYLEIDELPANVTALAPAPAPPASDPYDGGIYFDCVCGGPMWVTRDLAGSTGRCRYCGQRLIVPHVSGAPARPEVPSGAGDAPPETAVHERVQARLGRPAAPIRLPRPIARGKGPRGPTPPLRREPGAEPAPAAKPAPAANPAGEPGRGQGAPSAPAHALALCSICQTEILAGEEQTSCPSCHLTFHKGCWEENFGCSAYGCDQVNVLAPPQPTTGGPETPGTQAAPPAGHAQAPARGSPAGLAGPVELPLPPAFPWESFLLALAFVTTGIGALAFGAPSAIILAWAAVFLFSRKVHRRGLAVLAVVISALGTLAGVVTSMFWWNGVRLWERVIR